MGAESVELETRSVDFTFSRSNNWNLHPLPRLLERPLSPASKAAAPEALKNDKLFMLTLTRKALISLKNSLLI